MDLERESALATQRIKELAHQGAFEIPGGDRAEMRPAVPVFDARGALHSWMAPFTLGQKLVAYAQLSRSLELMRFSTFAGGKVESAPTAEDWLDPARVQARAAAVAAPDEALSTPLLTFDRDPSRLVWSVEGSRPGGRTRRWFVIGDSVWEDRGEADATGGAPPR
jgi:hypothetical protein